MDLMTMTTTDSVTMSRVASRRGNRVPPGESHPISAPPHHLLIAPRCATSPMTPSLPAAPTLVATSALPSPSPSRLRHHPSLPKKPTHTLSKTHWHLFDNQCVLLTTRTLSKPTSLLSKAQPCHLDNSHPFKNHLCSFNNWRHVESPPCSLDNPCPFKKPPVLPDQQPTPF